MKKDLKNTFDTLSRNGKKILVFASILLIIFLAFKTWRETTGIKESPTWECRNYAISICQNCMEKNLTESECVFSERFVDMCRKWCPYIFGEECVVGKIIPCRMIGIAF